jgi:hypothetical protein
MTRTTLSKIAMLQPLLYPSQHTREGGTFGYGTDRMLLPTLAPFVSLRQRRLIWKSVAKAILRRISVGEKKKTNTGNKKQEKSRP